MTPRTRRPLEGNGRTAAGFGLVAGRRRLGHVLAAVGLVLVAGCATDTGPADEPALATVVRVVDGDTLVLRFHGDDVRARLIGIDTPEAVKPNAPVECYGPEASAEMRRLLPPGSTVTLERDVEPRDRFDRLLVYVRRSDDGTFVNLALVAGGFATTLRLPPNTAHAEALSEAERTARTARKGLWGAC